MIQRFLIGIGALNFLAVIFLFAHLFIFQNKVVYIDSTKLLNNYKGMVDARSAYEKKAIAWKANIDTLSVEIQRQIVSYEKGSSMMSTKERQIAKESIQAKQKQLYDYQQATGIQAQQEDERLTGEIVMQVN